MANKKVKQAGKAAQSARSNPSVQRLIDDEDLRQSISHELRVRPRCVRRRLSTRQELPAKQLFEDKKLQKHIRETAGGVRDASVALYEAPKKQKSGGGLGRVLPARRRRRRGRARLSEGLRKKVLDALFGAEEEFEYTSTTSSPSSTRPRAPRPGQIPRCRGRPCGPPSPR